MKAPATIAIALVVGALAACVGRVAHVFGGYAYDEAGDCLLTPGVVDVIDGPAGTPCKKVRCWVAPDGTVYVTDTACDAPPDYQDQTQASSGLCVKALEAYEAEGHGRCPTAPDGGTADTSDGAGDGGT